MNFHFIGDAMQNRRVKASRCLLAAILGIFLLTVSNFGFAQDMNASLSGTVVDPSNAAVPGAKLTLVNEGSGVKLESASDNAGEYTFRNLPPGKYDLTTTAIGFKSESQKGLELLVTQVARVDVH